MGGSGVAGEPDGAVSDTITGTKVVANSTLGSSIWHSSLLLAPAEELTDMDAGRAGNLRDHRIRLKAGRNKALLVLA